MSTIRSTLQITDAMSAPLKRITTALNMTISAMQRLETATSTTVDTDAYNAIRTEIARANIELDEMTNNARQASTAVDSLAQSSRNISFNDTSSQLDKLIGQAKNIGTAFLSWKAISGGAKAIVGASDAFAQSNARLGLLVNSSEELKALQNDIFASAERSRSSYSATARTVARVGMNAKNAFSNTDEMVAFAEQMNKKFIIAGATMEEQEAALIQLSQGMGSGVLRGEELNSVFEAAPNIIQTIADYLNVPIGSIRNMASEGQITAEVIKNAMFAAAEETDEQFKNMPLTWEQVMNSMKNMAMMATKPILEGINAIWKSDGFQSFKENVTFGLFYIAKVGTLAFTRLMNMFSYPIFTDLANGAIMAGIWIATAVKWGIDAVTWLLDTLYSLRDVLGFLEPIVYALGAGFAFYGLMVGLAKTQQWGLIAAQTIMNGKMAISSAIGWAHNTMLAVKAWGLKSVAIATFTAIGAQMGFNGALGIAVGLLSTLVIGFIAVAGAIGLGVVLWNKFTGASVSALGTVMGLVYSAGAFIWDLFVGLIDFVLICLSWIANGFIWLGNTIVDGIGFSLGIVVKTFSGMADTVLSILETIGGAIDWIFGSNLKDTVSGWRDGLTGMTNELVANIEAGTEASKEDYVDWRAEDLGLKYLDIGKAWDSGYKQGEKWENKLGDMFGKLTDIEGMKTREGFKSPVGDETELAYGDMMSSLGNIDANTGKMADSMEISEEDLKYMRDIAEREVINRFTTAEIKIDMTNNNNISSDQDLDGIVNYLEEKLYEGMVTAAEGVTVV